MLNSFIPVFSKALRAMFPLFFKSVCSYKFFGATIYQHLSIFRTTLCGICAKTCFKGK